MRWPLRTRRRDQHGRAPGAEPALRLEYLRDALAERTPDAYWRAAALLEQIILLRPLPVRSELFAYGVAAAYLEASGERVDTAYEPWRDLSRDIQALRLTVYDVADRLRSWRVTGPPD
ncbi:hypothetical protein ACH4NR_37860 [Streptomyces globisporus]|uniref:hypothetical protein n=1 Tax=Streptomyces globisporus TaxID=1908 RepID=UPI0037A0612F